MTLDSDQQLKIKDKSQLEAQKRFDRMQACGISYPTNQYSLDHFLNSAIMAIEYQLEQGMTFEEALEWAIPTT